MRGRVAEQRVPVDDLELVGWMAWRGDRTQVRERDGRSATVAITYEGGHTYTVLTLDRPADEGPWSIAAVESCARVAQELPTTEVVDLHQLEVGHCWVEPFQYDGGTWSPQWQDQFGWGGPWPDDFANLGLVEVESDQLRYSDLEGAELVLVPTDDPRAQWPPDFGCD